MGLSAPVQALLQLLISWRFSGKSGGKPVLASFPFLHREHVCKCAAARGSRVGWGAPCGSSTQSALRLGYSTTQNCCLMTPVSRTHRAAVQDCQWFLRSPLPLGGLNLLGKNINSKGRETRKFVIFKQGLQVRGFRLRNKLKVVVLSLPHHLCLACMSDMSFWVFFSSYACHMEQRKEVAAIKVPFKCELKQRDMKL